MPVLGTLKQSPVSVRTKARSHGEANNALSDVSSSHHYISIAIPTDFSLCGTGLLALGPLSPESLGIGCALPQPRCSFPRHPCR